jgi:hypothetical protein
MKVVARNMQFSLFGISFNDKVKKFKNVDTRHEISKTFFFTSVTVRKNELDSMALTNTSSKILLGWSSQCYKTFFG